MSGFDEKDLNDLERLLGELAPRPAALERDRLLFRAGQASARRPLAWPLATLAASTLAGCLALMLIVRPPAPGVRVVVQHVPIHIPVEPHVPDGVDEPGVQFPQAWPQSGPSAALSCWRLQQEALRFGVEQMPATMAVGDETLTPRSASEDLSAGSRPMVINQLSLFPFGEP